MLIRPEARTAARNATRPLDPCLSRIAPVAGFPIKILRGFVQYREISDQTNLENLRKPRNCIGEA